MKYVQRAVIMLCVAAVSILTAFGQVASKVEIVHMQNVDGSSTTLFGRERLFANRTYYVRTDGNDENAGLADDASHAFRTIQHAVNMAMALDSNGCDVTIQIADGTYNETVSIGRMIGIGSSSLNIVGNISSPDSVVLNGATGYGALHVTNNVVPVVIQGIRLTGAHGIYADTGAQVKFGAVDFGPATSSQIIAHSAVVTAIGNYSISGAAASHVRVETPGARVSLAGRAITLLNMPAFSNAFVYAAYSSLVSCQSCSFSGAATGRRYEVSLNAVVATGGQGETFLPGNAGGSVSLGGQYW